MSDMILDISGLTKQFGALVANDDISVGIERGTIHGIIGPNGSGKSTFFNCVSGFYSVDGGTIVFDGTDITGWESHDIAQRGLVRTFQISRPFEEISVKKNLLSVFRPGLRITQAERDRADEVLALLDIDHLADSKAKDLSGGQQNLLDLARVLMLDPACILLDEPMAGVNPALQDRILQYLREMNDTGTSFVIIEHNMKVIDRITDAVTVFDSGRVIAEGSFEEITADPRVRQAYLSGDQSTMEELLS